jgi:hypothetical protein
MKTNSIQFVGESKTKYYLKHSLHSQCRASERGITDNDIQIALDFSESIFKQGLIFHIVMDKLIPSNLPKKQVSRIKNMVIVMANDEPRIITCYKSNKALSKIRKKSKRLHFDAYSSISNIA